MLIYKIITPHSKKCYVGKTTKTIRERLQRHRGHFREWNDVKGKWCSSFGLLWLGDCTIELLEETNDPLAEARWIRKLDTVNIKRPSLTVEEEETRAKARHSKYYNSHKKEQQEYYRQYHEKNPGLAAKWYQSRKHSVLAKNALKIACDRCGMIRTAGNMLRHQRTARCIRLSNAEGNTV